MDKFREEVVKEADAAAKKKASLDPGSRGYGGKFGVENDRMDKSAVGHDYHAPLMKHASQKDYATGFGGKFGVQNDRLDKVMLNKSIRIEFACVHFHWFLPGEIYITKHS